MTLDEAILHCREKAEELRTTAEQQWEDGKMALIDYTDCRECASEHQQLAEWLEELKDRREGHATCEFCKHKFRLETERPCSLCKHNFVDKFEKERSKPWQKTNRKTRDQNHP